MNLIYLNPKSNNINEILNDIIIKINENKLNKKNNELSKNKNIKNRYKVVFIGSSGIGAKTSLISRIINNTFVESLSSTDGASFSSKTVKLRNGKEVILDLWDTSGQEKYIGLTKVFYQNADCIVLGFDITRKYTFEEVKNFWYKDTINNSKVNLMYLVGCKIDLIDQRYVSLDEAINFAEENNLRYFEVSNTDNIGIEEFVDDLAYEIIKQ